MYYIEIKKSKLFDSIVIIKTMIALFLLCLLTTGCNSINHTNIVCDKTQHKSLVTATFNTSSYLHNMRENDSISFYTVVVANHDMQYNINELIFNDIKISISDLLYQENITLHVEYEIKLMNDRLLSIVYTGIGFMEGAARPYRFFHTINIDMKSGVIITMNDVINDYESLIDLLLSPNATYHTPYNGIEEFTRTMIANDSFLHRLLHEIEINFYFTYNNVGFIIGGLGGAAGDFIKIEIPNDKLIDYSNGG